ncbi:hypothetical protein ACH63S_28000, partial [Klebsiella pneumoniae]
KRAYCLKTQPATGETYPKSDLFNKAILKGKKMPSPRFGSHLWQCLCTLSGKSLRTVSCPALIF